MFDFLTGFLLGIIFTFGATLFGVYKLLLRHGDGSSSALPQFDPSRSVRHSISKHTSNDQNVESCEWVNTLASWCCVEALSSPLLVESIHKQIHEMLNKPEDKPDALGNIVISDINLGAGLPLVDGLRVLSRSSDDSLHAEVGLRYTGGASFTISTELWANWPTPKFVALPVSLSASLDHFAGTLTASCYSMKSSNSMRLVAFFLAPPTFQLRIGSTIGHSTKLVNVSQVSSLLENMIYSLIRKELVFPNGFEIDLEDGKVVCVRKLASVRSITEKGENAPTQTQTQQAQANVDAATPRTNKGERDLARTGDLTHRGFTVTTN